MQQGAQFAAHVGIVPPVVAEDDLLPVQHGGLDSG
jgi:hypothetical protein